LRDARNENQPLELFLFFDESLCKMEKCRSGCQRKESILCKHRFPFDTYIFYNKIFGTAGLPDFDVVLHCFEYIAKIKRNEVKDICWKRTTKKKFIILTKDEGFFKEAASKIKKAKRHGLAFDRENQSISREGTTVYVIFLECGSDCQKRYGQRLFIINELHRRADNELAPF